jgi:hypothetical protein
MTAPAAANGMSRHRADIIAKLRRDAAERRLEALRRIDRFESAQRHTVSINAAPQQRPALAQPVDDDVDIGIRAPWMISQTSGSCPSPDFCSNLIIPAPLRSQGTLPV